jgi:hypothetical protein
MGRVCSMTGIKGKAYRILVGSLKGKKGGMDWIDLV